MLASSLLRTLFRWCSGGRRSQLGFDLRLHVQTPELNVRLRAVRLELGLADVVGLLAGWRTGRLCWLTA